MGQSVQYFECLEFNDINSKHSKYNVLQVLLWAKYIWEQQDSGCEQKPLFWTGAIILSFFLPSFLYENAIMTKWNLEKTSMLIRDGHP